MSHFIPYLALASLPASQQLAVNPVRISWDVHHGSEPMPAAVRDKAESVDHYLYFVIDGLTVGFIVWLVSLSGVRATEVGLRTEQWKSNLAIGIGAGALLVLTQVLSTRLSPKMQLLPTSERYQRGSVGLWVVVCLSGAFAEEFWIAFCLVSMTATGHSVFISVTATAAVFAAVHLKYGLDGMYVVGLRGAATALLFLWTGSLIPMALFHFIGNLGNLYWVRRLGAGTAELSGLEGARPSGG